MTDRDNTRLQDSTVNSIAADVDYELTDRVTNSLHLSYGSSEITFKQYPSDFDVASDVNILIAENRVIFQSPDSNYSSVVGLYYSNTESTSNIADFIYRDGDVITTAIYGETTYEASPNLKLIGGGRYEHESNRSDLDYGTLTGIIADTSTNIFLPKVGIIYDIDEQTTVNSSIRKGYNAGGYAYSWDNNEYYSYDEESVIAYEAGMRNTFGDIELNTNLFFNDYNNYVAYDSSADYFLNMADSHTYGIEFEGSYWVNDSIKLRGSYGYLVTEITSDDNSYKGNELTNAPDTSVALGVTHYIGEHLSYNADLYYVGDYYSDLANSDDYKAGDYVTANLSLQYAIGDYVIDGYIKNLTDEDVVYTVTSTRAAVGQSRTIGLNATYRW